MNDDEHLRQLMLRSSRNGVSDFDDAFTAVVLAEGGYVNDPDDPGGETKYGVSARAYPNEDIKNMTLERAKMLYRRDYWDMTKCDSIPPPLNKYVFDAAVNQGTQAAIKMLQKSVNVAQDGIFGRDTERAIERNNIPQLCALFMAERAIRYTSTRNADKYLRGWLKRLFSMAMKGI